MNLPPTAFPPSFLKTTPCPKPRAEAGYGPSLSPSTTMSSFEAAPQVLVPMWSGIAKSRLWMEAPWSYGNAIQNLISCAANW